jgi:hypothetical protein
VVAEGADQQTEPVKQRRVVAAQVDLVAEGIDRSAQGEFEGVEVGVAGSAKLAEEIVLIDDDLDGGGQGRLLGVSVRPGRGPVKNRSSWRW